MIATLFAALALAAPNSDQPMKNICQSLAPEDIVLCAYLKSLHPQHLKRLCPGLTDKEIATCKFLHSLHTPNRKPLPN